MKNRYQVVIVGGGPLGVVLAVDLGLRGISCVLVESRPELGRVRSIGKSFFRSKPGGTSTCAVKKVSQPGKG